MTSLGETLRRARLKRNLELSRIADELKISASMLKAIEDERFDKLPGGVFARSFVRQYARLLELDDDEIVGELRRVLEPPPELPELSREAHASEAEIPLPRVRGWQAVSDQGIRWSSPLVALGLMVVAMLVCAAAYTLWQRERRPVSAHEAREKNPVPAQVAPIVQSETPPAVLPAVPGEPPPAKAENPAAQSPAAQAPASPVSTPAPKQESSPGPPKSATPAADPNSNAPLQVEVIAEQQVWISARADGEYSFSGVLEANQSRTVGANRNVWLKVGNAAGVQVRLNGKSIGPLGGPGVVRTLQLTSGGFKILAPDAPKPAPADSPNPL